MTKADTATMVEAQVRGFQATGIQASFSEEDEYHTHGALSLWGGGTLRTGVHV